MAGGARAENWGRACGGEGGGGRDGEGRAATTVPFPMPSSGFVGCFGTKSSVSGGFELNWVHLHLRLGLLCFEREIRSEQMCGGNLDGDPKYIFFSAFRCLFVCFSPNSCSWFLEQLSPQFDPLPVCLLMYLSNHYILFVFFLYF